MSGRELRQKNKCEKDKRTERSQTEIAEDEVLIEDGDTSSRDVGRHHNLKIKNEKNDNYYNQDNWELNKKVSNSENNKSEAENKNKNKNIENDNKIKITKMTCNELFDKKNNKKSKNPTDYVQNELFYPPDTNSDRIFLADKKRIKDVDCKTNLGNFHEDGFTESRISDENGLYSQSSCLSTNRPTVDPLFRNNSDIICSRSAVREQSDLSNRGSVCLADDYSNLSDEKFCKRDISDIYHPSRSESSNLHIEKYFVNRARPATETADSIPAGPDKIYNKIKNYLDKEKLISYGTVIGVPHIMCLRDPSTVQTRRISSTSGFSSRQSRRSLVSQQYDGGQTHGLGHFNRTLSHAPGQVVGKTQRDIASDLVRILAEDHESVEQVIMVSSEGTEYSVAKLLLCARSETLKQLLTAKKQTGKLPNDDFDDKDGERIRFEMNETAELVESFVEFAKTDKCALLESTLKLLRTVPICSTIFPPILVDALNILSRMLTLSDKNGFAYFSQAIVNGVCSLPSSVWEQPFVPVLIMKWDITNLLLPPNKVPKDSPLMQLMKKCMDSLQKMNGADIISVLATSGSLSLWEPLRKSKVTILMSTCAIQVNVCLSDSVRSLKCFIFDKMRESDVSGFCLKSNSSAQLRLHFGGIRLDDQKTLADCGIKSGSEIICRDVPLMVTRDNDRNFGSYLGAAGRRSIK